MSPAVVSRRLPPLGDAQRDVLDTLRRAGRALSVAALAEDTGLTPGRCGAIAASLAARGLVERVGWSAREHGWAALDLRCTPFATLPLARSPRPLRWAGYCWGRSTLDQPGLDEWAALDLRCTT